jgi:hypothetical protein
MLRLPIFKTNKAIYKLTDEEQLKALIIEQVYKNPSERKNNIFEYELDKEFNDEILVVYKSVFDNIAIIGIRGTATLKDIITDIKLVAEQLTNIKFMEKSDRFKKLHKMILDIYYKYKNYNYTIKLTGHSLSGYEIMRLENLEPNKVSDSTAFNAGGPPITFYKIPKDVKHIRNPLDPISQGFKNDIQTKEYYNNKLSSINPLLNNPLSNHSINYFLN